MRSFRKNMKWLFRRKVGLLTEVGRERQIVSSLLDPGKLLREKEIPFLAKTWRREGQGQRER